ncbi:zinc finger domain-containing protein [Paenarthrobacter nitroguajacolicus]|uniref:zinc finger domain-containing protein n=1 Tax=Paenarthrobacter nitroguajacolicus TaxID=211146 RepID=UPI001AEAB109
MGYFDSLFLHSYGRGGQPCERCGASIVREPFMNRSSYRCPKCQPKARTKITTRLSSYWPHRLRTRRPAGLGSSLDVYAGLDEVMGGLAGAQCSLRS